MITIIIIISGCYTMKKNNQNREMPERELQDSTTEEQTENGTMFQKEFGTYELPKNWIESKKHSSKEKFFYVLQGQEENKQPNNISVNSGINRYAKTEHEKFRKAIVNQILLQIGNEKGIEMNANGSTTNTGEILYTFIIKEKDVTTIQYYIVGDYKYILIQETTFEESEETDNAAKNIINTFKWKE